MHEAVVWAVNAKRAAAGEVLGRALGRVHPAPRGEVVTRLALPQPQPAIVPALWKYDEVRALLMEAGGLLTVQEAERRVLVLENPGIRGASQITQSLYAGLQLIQPGEVAASHRHTARALRFIVEGDGRGYPAGDGGRTAMRTGRFVLTPSWTFHDHGNLGSAPVIWMDVLDVPIVNLFDTSFAEHHPEEVQPVARRDGDAPARFGANMVPLEYSPKRQTSPSPVFSYPYSRSREALKHLHDNGPVDPHHGVKLQDVNPATGGYPMPTIAAF